MKTTLHAEKRMQQRGLNDPIIEVIMQCGRIESLPGGVSGRFFGNKEYNKAMEILKKVQKCLERAKNSRVIIDGDEILTVYKNGRIDLHAS